MNSASINNIQFCFYYLPHSKRIFHLLLNRCQMFSRSISVSLDFAFFLSLSVETEPRKWKKKIDMFEVYFFFLGVMKTRTPHICQLLISLQIHHQQLFSIPYKSPISALLMHCRWIIDDFFCTCIV